MRPHASVGTAVKLPTMFEQFGTDQFFVPNPDLTPEKSFGWDAGVEFTFNKGRALFDVTYFRANLTDKINGFFFDPAIGNFTAINLPGESTREGVEVSARFKLARNLTLGGAYTYTDARDPNGQREIRRPPHAARADVAYAFDGGRGSATLGAVYNGRMDDTAFVLPFFIRRPSGWSSSDYWLVNATASYKLQPGVEMFGRVENLLNQHYQEMFGYEVGADRRLRGRQADLRRDGRHRRQRAQRGRGASRRPRNRGCRRVRRPASSASLLLLAAIAVAARASALPAGSAAALGRGATPPHRLARLVHRPARSSSWWTAGASPP